MSEVYAEFSSFRLVKTASGKFDLERACNGYWLSKDCENNTFVQELGAWIKDFQEFKPKLESDMRDVLEIFPAARVTRIERKGNEL